MSLPAFLPEHLPEPLTALERAEAARDAAVYDIIQTHRLLDEVGVPRRVDGRLATASERVWAFLLCVPVGSDARRALAAVGEK